MRGRSNHEDQPEHNLYRSGAIETTGPKMYELVKYEELEEQRAFRTGQSRETEQKLTEVQPQEPEKKLTKTRSQEPGKKLAAGTIPGWKMDW